MFWALITSLNGLTYSLKSTLTDRFFEKLFTAILVTFQSFYQKSSGWSLNFFPYFGFIGAAWPEFWNNSWCLITTLCTRLRRLPKKKIIAIPNSSLSAVLHTISLWYVDVYSLFLCMLNMFDKCQVQYDKKKMFMQQHFPYEDICILMLTLY